MNAKTLRYPSILQSDAEAKKWLSEKSSAGLGYFIANYFDHPDSTPRPVFVSSYTASVDVYDALKVPGAQELNSDNLLATIHFDEDDLLSGFQCYREARERCDNRQFIPTDNDYKATLQEEKYREAGAKHRVYRFMIRLAAELEANAETLAVLETISTGRTIRRTIKDVVPRCVQHFNFYARFIFDIKNLYEVRRRDQKVLIVNIPADASLTVLVERLAPALAVGLYVIVVLDETKGDQAKVNLALFYFVEKIAELDQRLDDRGRFKFCLGTVSLYYTRRPFLQFFSRDMLDPLEISVSYAGNISETTKIPKVVTDKSMEIPNLRIVSTTGPHSLLVLIFDSSDIDSAIECLVSALCIAIEQSLPYRILIYEGIWNDVMSRLILRLNRLRDGPLLDKNTDMGTLTSIGVTQIRKKLEAFPCEMKEFRHDAGLFLSFRSISESVELANDCVLDVRASVWTENQTLASQVADFLVQANVVWINCFELYDAEVPIACARRQSGNSVVGGLRCAYEHLERSIFDYIDQDAPTGQLSSAELDNLKCICSRAMKNATNAAGHANADQCLDFLREVSLAIDRHQPVFSYSTASHPETALNAYDCLSKWQRNIRQAEFHLELQTNGGKAAVTVNHAPLGSVAVVCDGRCDVRDAFMFYAVPAIAFGNSVVFIIVDESIETMPNVGINHPLLTDVLKKVPPKVLEVVTVKKSCEEGIGDILKTVAECNFDVVFLYNELINGVSDLDCSERAYLILSTDQAVDHERFSQKMFFKLTKPKSVWNTC